MKSIFLAGNFGFDNCGDEAMLAGTIRWLEARDPDAAIRILSLRPEQTAAEHGRPALPALPMGRLLPLKILLKPRRWKTIAALWRADLVVWVAGSGVFSDARGCTIRQFWPLFVLLRMLARKLIVLSASAGPIDFPETRAIVRRMERAADAIGLRDSESYALLRAIVGDSPKLLLMADMAFELGEPPAAARLDGIWRREQLEAEARHVAFCSISFFQTPEQVPLIDAYREQYATAAAAALDALARDGLTPLFIPFERGHDETTARAIAARMKERHAFLRGAYSPQEMLGILGRMDLVIGLKFHSLVLSLMAQTPLVSIVYDEKSRGLLKDAGLQRLSMEYYIWKKERPPLDGERLAALAREALRDAAALRAQAAATTARMRERNKQGARRLEQIINEQ